MAKQQDIDVTVLFAEVNEQRDQLEQEVQLISSFLPDILKELLMLQELDQED